MAESHVLSGLLAKRSELAGKIEFAQAELRQMMIDLDSIDATIRLFNPEIDLVQIRPKIVPARNQAFRGEIARIVLGTLRKAGKPLPTHEVALHVMAARSLNMADKPLLRVINRRVGAAMRHHRIKGLIRSVPGPGRSVLWEIVR
ncbi:MAG: hypothetical protein ACK4UO_14670 [Pseudolabrys sp.]